jgi:hypothetical protein
MKTQSIGSCGVLIGASGVNHMYNIAMPRAAEALQQYKTSRENGDELDNPKIAFACAGLLALKITSSTNSAKGWPDAQNRYWWKLRLEDGSTNEEFAFECDNARGYPDKSDPNRYWFIIHGPNGVKMEGFSWEADRQKGFPDGSGNYWRYVQYTECGPIKEWMEEKDFNYLKRLSVKDPGLFKKELAELKAANSQHPAIKRLEQEQAKAEEQQRLAAEEKQRQEQIAERLRLAEMKELEDKKLREESEFSFRRPFKLNTAKEVKISAGPIPDNFRCPITHEIMLDPVMAMDGHAYEREAILQALEKSMLSPMTGQPMDSKVVIPNHSMRSMIRDFLTKNPECWQEVYVSTAAVNELLVLSLGTASLDLRKWESILRADPRLLTLPLQGVTLLEVLCKQTESIVKTYLPALLNLLTPKDWQDLIRIYSAQDWLKLVAQTCERCAAPELAAEFLNKLQAGLGIKEINPQEMALYALEQKHLGLFKLALSQLKDVNVPVDGDKNTLLHLTARQGQTEMVQCLVNRGAHLKQRNAAGLKAEGVARLAGFEATADQIAVFKLTPVLERMGFFTGLRRLETMEKELGQLEALKKEVQELKASVSGPSGYAKKI